MIPDNDAIVIFRFSEHRWINAIIDGTLSFSCAGAFVEQAKLTDNEIQGDRYEGIFARLQPDDPKISKMERILGNDLIKMTDEKGFVLLRRRSAMLKPIFCYYAYKARDIIIDSDGNAKLGENTIRHDFDPKMFSGFSNGDWNLNVIADERRFTTLTLYPNHFISRIKCALAKENLSYVMKPVNYEEQKNDTFFIEPTDQYDELFCKRPLYSYQYEGRICLNGIDFTFPEERFSLSIGKLGINEYHKTHCPFYMETKAIFDKKKHTNVK